VIAFMRCSFGVTNVSVSANHALCFAGKLVPTPEHTLIDLDEKGQIDENLKTLWFLKLPIQQGKREDVGSDKV